LVFVEPAKVNCKLFEVVASSVICNVLALVAGTPPIPKFSALASQKNLAVAPVSS
jgi:hypothetical protein